MSLEDRRPIQARSIVAIQRFAAWLSKSSVTPNQISILSIFFAAWVPLAFAFFEAGSWAASLLAVAGIQLRLMCNLLDGMVAIEGAKKSPLGSIYNEFPDRVADTTVLLGLALVDRADAWLMVLAMLTALLAVMTAYTRLLGASIGTKQFFVGPMAKQHRMALLTVMILGMAALASLVGARELAYGTLLVIAAGCVWTVARRLNLIAQQMLDQAKHP
jgi:phosphatidylglycerophosphate synthase